MSAPDDKLSEDDLDAVVGGALKIDYGLIQKALQGGHQDLDDLLHAKGNAKSERHDEPLSSKDAAVQGFEAKGKGEAPGSGGSHFNQVGQTSSGYFGGIGTIVQATQEKHAAEHDAKKAELEANAKVHQAGVEAANDMMNQMMGVIKDVREKLSDIQKATTETQRGIARNI